MGCGRRRLTRILVVAMGLVGLLLGSGCFLVWDDEEPQIETHGALILPSDSDLDVSTAVVLSNSVDPFVADSGAFSFAPTREQTELVCVGFPNGLYLMNLWEQASGNGQAFFEASSADAEHSSRADFLVLDFSTTVMTLLYLNPALFHSNPERREAIARAMADSDHVQELVDKLEEIASSTEPLENAAFRKLYGEVLDGLVRALESTSSMRTEALVRDRIGIEAQGVDSWGESTGTYPLATSFRSIDLDVVELTSSKVHRVTVDGVNYFELRPTLSAPLFPLIDLPLTEPANWYLLLVELDAAQFTDMTEVSAIGRTDPVTWIAEVDDAALEGKSVWGYLDFASAAVDAVLANAPWHKVDEDKSTLKVEAERGGIYMLLASSGGSGIWSGERGNPEVEFPLLEQLHSADETDSMDSAAWELWRGAKAANLAKLAAHEMDAILGSFQFEAGLSKLGVKLGNKTFSLVTSELTDPTSGVFVASIDVYLKILLELCRYTFEEAVRWAANEGVKGFLKKLSFYLLYLPSIAGNAGEAADVLWSFAFNSPIERAIIVVGSGCLFDRWYPKLTLEEPRQEGSNMLFNWSSFDNCPTSKIEYRYRVLGPDVNEIWSDWRVGVPPLTLGSLPDGVFEFQVEAKDSSGNTSPVKSVTFMFDSQQPDLIVALDPGRVIPMLASVGESVTFEALVSNVGSDSTENTELAWHVSAIGQAHGTRIATDIVPPLAPGNTIVITHNFVQGSPGTSYYFAHIDSGDVASEEDEENNWSDSSERNGHYKVIWGDPEKADLRVSRLSATGEASPGSSLDITCSISNDGEAPSSLCVNSIVFSMDATITNHDLVLHTWNSSAIQPGESRAWSGQVTLPEWALPGETYYIGAVADSQDLVAEKSEHNNSRATSITIGSAGSSPEGPEGPQFQRICSWTGPIYLREWDDLRFSFEVEGFKLAFGTRLGAFSVSWGDGSLDDHYLGGDKITAVATYVDDPINDVTWLYFPPFSHEWETPGTRDVAIHMGWVQTGGIIHALRFHDVPTQRGSSLTAEEMWEQLEFECR